MRNLFRAAVCAVTLSVLFAPRLALACACGCGVFEVGTGAMMPTGPGGIAFIEYNFMNQNKNWSGNSSAPAANNSDKEIKTGFYTAGGEYMFNRAWGIQAEVPYWDRNFKTDTGSGIASYHQQSLGDIRIKGVYSGFSEDMSSGVAFGLKLPTGQFNDHNLDRDTSIGSGSTDVLLGAYHMGQLTDDHQFNWFANGQVDVPVAARDGYRPGNELDAAIGSYYNAERIGEGKISPLLQLIYSQRLLDEGVNAATGDSGYTRLLISPGIEYDVGRTKLYGDVEVPVYQFVRGNQLTAPMLIKLTAGYSF